MGDNLAGDASLDLKSSGTVDSRLGFETSVTRQRDTMNTTKQGVVGLSSAIHYFSKKGYVVSVPLVDAQAYDLIVDDGNRLLKVQVKTTGRKNKSGTSYIVKLDTVWTNATSNMRKNFDNTKVDYIYVYTLDGNEFLIPSNEITAVTDYRIPVVSPYKV